MPATTPVKLTVLLLLFLFANAYHSSGQSSNWAMTLDVNDPQWINVSTPNISKTARLSDGYVVCGSTYKGFFPSKDGNSFGYTNFGGIYLAKYDFSGNLKWIDYGIDSNHLFHMVNSCLTSVTTDSNDNIYICGNFPTAGRFYYNGGQSNTRIATQDTTGFINYYYQAFFVAKLNSAGQPVWHANLYNSAPSNIRYAPNGKLILAANSSGSPGWYGIDTANTYTSVNSWPFNARQLLYWIDTGTGHLNKWATIDQSNVNGAGIVDIAADAAGNLYICGVSEFKTIFRGYNTADTLQITTPLPTAYGGRFYLTKYDTAAYPVWKVYDHRTLSSVVFPGVVPTSLGVSADGAAYVSGVSWAYNTTDTLLFFNRDSSISYLPCRPQTLYKIDRNGYLEWAANQYGEGTGAVVVRDTDVVLAGYNNYMQQTVGYTDTLRSASGQSYLVLESANPNIHFIRYDTSGNILSACAIGASNGSNSYTNFGMIRANGDAVLFNAEYRAYSNTDSTLFFQDTVRSNDFDGLMIKFAPGNNCDSAGPVSPAAKLMIKEPFNDTLLCVGSSFTVQDSMYGLFAAPNTISAELSDDTGSFDNPLVIGAATPAGSSVYCTIPASLIPGSGYRIRLVSTNPSRYSNIKSITIIPAITPLGSLSVSPGTTVPSGTTIYFKALTSAGVYYRWLINGVLVPGAVADSFATSTLYDGDIVSVIVKSLLPCATPDSIVLTKTIHITTGVQEAMQSFTAAVFPNPNTGTFDIHAALPFAGTVTAEITDMVGRTIYKGETASGKILKWTINLDKNIPAGTYNLQLRCSGLSFITRLAVIK